MLLHALEKKTDLEISGVDIVNLRMCGEPNRIHSVTIRSTIKGGMK
jgi:hypothetical protein